MKSIKLKLSHKVLLEINMTIQEGEYENRDAFINDAIKNLLFYKELGKHIGSIPNTGDSVKEVRAIRKRLSREDPDLRALSEI